ncbi:MAG: hypothetical protein ACPHM2_07470, partial [Alcanivorax sp.]
MWLHEIPVGGLLISPMVLFVLLGMVLTLLTLVLPGLLLTTGMLMIFLWKCLNVPTSGLMVAER